MTDDIRQTIRSLFQAYVADDRASAERLIAPGFTFTSPYDDRLDRAAYFDKCWPNAGRIEQIALQSVMVEGDAAYVAYKATAPGGKTFHNVEFMTFDDGQIVTVDVYFGAEYRDGEFVPR